MRVTWAVVGDSARGAGVGAARVVRGAAGARGQCGRYSRTQGSCVVRRLHRCRAAPETAGAACVAP